MTKIASHTIQRMANRMEAIQDYWHRAVVSNQLINYLYKVRSRFAANDSANCLSAHQRWQL